MPDATQPCGFAYDHCPIEPKSVDALPDFEDPSNCVPIQTDLAIAFIYSPQRLEREAQDGDHFVGHH
jgi:hypothetical protein